MAQVVAMATVIEDFDSQPCKKPRKDMDSSSVKPITSYYMPVSKPGEKTFSPPRSNNIMNYFLKSPPVTEQLKENRHSATETPVKPSKSHRLKRGRKPGGIPTLSKQADNPQEVITVQESSCSGDEVVNTSGFLGSDTAMTFAQMSAETTAAPERTCMDDCSQHPSERRGSVRRNLPVEDSSELVNKQEANAPEMDQSLCDASLEVNVDETSKLNDSTVTVSFEEFLLSQTQEGPNNADALSEPTSTQQVSPETLTIQAEVHPVRQVPNVLRTQGKRMASIFTRRRDEDLSNATTRGKPQLLLDPKRKSNVVLPEEQLELSVIEPSSSSKCSLEERRQFMSAFRQPELDGAKGKAKKSMAGHEETEVPHADGVLTKEPPEVLANVENPEDTPLPARKNLAKRGRKKKEEMQTPDPPPQPVQEEQSQSEPNDTPSGSLSLRRSSRTRTQAVAAEVIQVTPSPMKPKSRKQSEQTPQSTPSLVDTPKTHKPKRSVYRAELLSPPDVKESPIRMRFQRVLLDPSDASEFDILSPECQKSSKLKTRKRAKKLVEKAKAIQQNKQKSACADTVSLRRSLRNTDAKQKSYCENEDSVVCLEECEDVSAPEKVTDAKEKGKSKKELRSLNEVLGKPASANKKTKGCAATKVPALFPGKKLQKPPSIISIFDDSSRDGSENSQDDEQFRARREFLKSGLPESFKKQIAKTAAYRDAYSLCGTSFLPVLHVLQRPLDCTLWNLPWPESSLLKDLKNFNCEMSTPRVPEGQLKCINTLPATRASIDRGSGWREDFPQQIHECLLEKIRTSNPQFPARRFFTWFQKRRAEHLLHCSTSATALVAPDASGRKRKRRSGEESRAKGSKRQRPSREEPIVIEDRDAEPVASEMLGRCRLSRSQRQQQQQAAQSQSVCTSIQNGPVIVLDDATPLSPAIEDCVKEDVLWTEKYQPQHSSEVMGNVAAVRKLHSWLKEWKQRADREERNSQKEKKHGDDSNDSWDCGDFQGEDAEAMEEQLCNTLLITGPPGVGKTAAVYACAQELGFKVFEVNASSQRSGRQILSQLKEATQSHQVELQGVNALKPSYFSSYSASARYGASPRKVNSPRKVVSSPRKAPQSPRSAVTKKGSLAPTSLANFFKMGRTRAPSTDGQVQHLQTGDCTEKARKVSKVREGPEKKPADKAVLPAEEQGKKTATSLILFEEVDVIFEEDSGFLAAIKTLMTTTKRPVILTTSDPAFSDTFDEFFEEIHFKTPSVANISSYLQLLCLAENVWMSTQDLSSLLHWSKCDIRRALLHLQFWSRSGAQSLAPTLSTPPSRPTDGAAGPTVPQKAARPPEEEVAAEQPHHESRCTESLLGLHNIHPELDLQEMCKSHSEPENQTCLDLLTASWRHGVDLLYTNMEHLLPLPSSVLPVCSQPNKADTQKKEEHGAPSINAKLCEPWAESSPLKVSSRMKRKKILAEKASFLSDSDSDDGFLSLRGKAAPVIDGISEMVDFKKTDSTGVNLHKTKKLSYTPEEQKAEALVSSCLGSLAELMDHMSFLDSSLQRVDMQMEGPCRSGMFSWTGAEIKTGLTDEPREEWWDGEERTTEIKAAVESLSFRRCQRSISEAWTGEQELRSDVTDRLTLPVASHRQAFSLAQTPHCEQSVTERRCDIMRTLVSCKALGTLGNKSATVLDYLPSLRTMCRAEKLKEQGKVKRRFMHYLESIHLGLSKNTMQLLSEDFP